MARRKSEHKTEHEETRKTSLTMKLDHIISTQQFLQREYIKEIFNLADKFQNLNTKNKLPQILKGKLLATVFYEPSTRTRFSFESAMLKLGG